MAITPNLGPISEISYVVIGLVFVAGGLFWTTAPALWVRIFLGIAGLITVLEGVIGY